MDASGRLTAAPKESAGDNGSAYGSSVAHSILFKLPRELRDYIYEYSFSGCRYQVTKHGGIAEPALLSTYKVIRDEATLTFYGHLLRLLGLPNMMSGVRRLVTKPSVKVECE